MLQCSADIGVTLLFKHACIRFKQALLLHANALHSDDCRPMMKLRMCMQYCRLHCTGTVSW